MGCQSEGRETKMVWVKETTLGTKPGTPTGYRIPFTPGGLDLNPGEGFVDFEEVDGESYPSTPMGSRHSPSMRARIPLHWDSIGHIFTQAIGIPTTTGASDPYTHVFTLGGSNGEAVGFEVERQQNDQTKVSRLFYGGIVSTLGFSYDVEGGVGFDVAAEFMKYDDWGSSLFVSSPTEYTSDAIDSLIGIIKVGGSAVGYVSGFTFNLDWQLQADRFPVGYEGWRYCLSRGKSKLGGTLDAFLSDAAVTALVDPAEAGTAVAFDIEFTETASNRELLFDINAAKLKITGEPIDTTAGLNVSFDWRTSGSGCFVTTLYNDVASY